MPSVHDAIRSAGIVLEAGDGPPVLRGECSRMARLVRESLASTVGLAPAWDDVAVPAPAMELARALASMSDRPVGVVDALGSWGCASELTGGSNGDGTPATSQLLDNLALITLRPPDPYASLGSLKGWVVREAAVYGHLVVDLTGFEDVGERRAAFNLLDAAVVVARCGRTTIRQVEDALRDVPEGRGLGVLLTGL